ncbi:head decoration protein [Methylorubrum sp. DB1722]|uniref:head decoration protein n=1 Tax=Methylorubrum sp. DB1722 TaxID=2478916 RepID=UPI0018E32461|nr:head decoration protein [Methylorubrum sp. DB1722]MBI1689525.1 head decoration protein [Methylorubrum sp. DB1722]
MYATRRSEKTHDAAFIKSDLGLRSYSRGKVQADQEFEPGTPMARLTATGFLVRYDNVGADGSEKLAGFLVARILPGFPGEFEVAALLSGDGEVFADRIPFPTVLDGNGAVDAAATAALKVALVAEAEALGIQFRPLA